MAGKEFREVRKRLGNEPADSSPYVGYARALLGELKEDMARNGLQQGVRRRSLNGGAVQVEVSSVFGQDEIKIIVPTGEEQSETTEETREEPMPYLWVGVRKNWEKSGLDNWMEYGVVVSEPGENGILAGLWTSWGDPPASWPDSINTAVQDLDWENDYRWTHVPKDRRYYKVGDEIRNPTTTYIMESGSLKFTKGNMRMYEWEEFRVPDSGEWTTRVLPPHDPLASQEDIDARVFPGWMADADKALWDTVVVLDPYQGVLDPTDRRPGDVEAGRLIGEATGAGAGKVIGGEYAIKIVGYGEDCRWSESADNQIFDSEMTGYHDPLILDLEVRVNKYPNTITKRYEVTLIRATYFFRNLWPFGDPAQNGIGCPSNMFGDINHHYSCWWQDCVLVNVNGGSIRLAEEYVPDYFGDNAGTKDPLPICTRKKWDIIIALGWGRVLTVDASVQGNVADQIWELYGMALTGSLGQLSRPDRTRDEILSAVVGSIGALGLYMYSVDSNSIVSVTDAVPQLNTENTGVTGLPFENYYRIQALLAGKGYGKVLYGWGGPFYDGFWKAGDPPHDSCIPNDVGLDYSI